MVVKIDRQYFNLLHRKKKYLSYKKYLWMKPFIYSLLLYKMCCNLKPIQKQTFKFARVDHSANTNKLQTVMDISHDLQNGSLKQQFCSGKKKNVSEYRTSYWKMRSIPVICIILIGISRQTEKQKVALFGDWSTLANSYLQTTNTVFVSMLIRNTPLRCVLSHSYLM